MYHPKTKEDPGPKSSGNDAKKPGEMWVTVQMAGSLKRSLHCGRKSTERILLILSQRKADMAKKKKKDDVKADPNKKKKREKDKEGEINEEEEDKDNKVEDNDYWWMK